MELRVEQVTVELSGVDVVRDVSIEVAPGQVVGLLGPNGCGKSTVLRTVYRALAPRRGAISIGGDDVWKLSALGSARRSAVLPQDTPADIELLALDLALLGRLPHRGRIASPTAEDRQIAMDALADLDVDHLAQRPVSTLSGGERQRVHLARALCQTTPVLVMDEPTNHLDVQHQLDLLERVRDAGATTIAAIHDLTLASAFCDAVVLLKEGKVVAAGTPDEVLTPDLVLEVFGVDCVVLQNPRTGTSVFALSAVNGRRSRAGRPSDGDESEAASL